MADWPQGLAYGLILGGALGNMIDRLLTGYVVDFVLLHWGHYYFPALQCRRRRAFRWRGVVDWLHDS